MADIEFIIKIPEKEFGIDIADKFQNFFSRLKVEIKEHLITNTSLVCGAYELETIDMFLKAFNNGIPLDNLTKEIEKELERTNWANEDYEEGYNNAVIMSLVAIHKYIGE